MKLFSITLNIPLWSRATSKTGLFGKKKLITMKREHINYQRNHYLIVVNISSEGQE